MYLIAISLFVMPIAAAGLLILPQGAIDGDLFMLALPMVGQQELLTVVAFIGGLSAATGMVIVSSVAVANMVSNDLLMPILLRRRRSRLQENTDMRGVILGIRRVTILILMLSSYLYHRTVGDAFPLAATGFLSLAAVAQFAPPLIGRLVWRGATAAGAFWGMVSGFVVWTYTLLLPSMARAGWIGGGLMENGLFGSGILMPQRLFGFGLDPFVHGVFWSLLTNIVVFMAISLRTIPRPIERLQASAFVDPDPHWGQAVSEFRTGSVTMEELQAVASRYLGPERAQRSFADLDPGNDPGVPAGENADLRLIRHTERLPVAFGRVGVPLTAIHRFAASRGDYGLGAADELATRAMDLFFTSTHRAVEHHGAQGRALEMRTCRTPGGGYVVTFSDITERVRNAAALAGANESLERRVRQRTAELARAKAAADEANHDKTRFLAAASHDLLQPLNAARLYAASLEERRIGGVEGELIRKLDGALTSVEDLLGALLDISKLDARAVVPEWRSFPLDAMFAALSVEFAPVAAQRGLCLRIMPCRLAVRSDWRLLRRVLQNLLANAIRYTPRGRVLMGVRRAGNRADIQVWDTGVGIPPDKHGLVFQEFQRFANTPDTGHGLGLGLSIVERISRVLDHPVTLRSTPGRGTVFGVSVPRGQATPVAAMPKAGELLAAMTVGPNAGVLCIDNDADILDGMRALLGGWRCRVRTASGLAEALTGIDEDPPDLLLVDQHLDDTADGFTCVEAVRRHLDRDVPAILITADRSEAVKAKALALGLPLLNKPLRPAALRTLMRRLLATHRMAG